LLILSACQNISEGTIITKNSGEGFVIPFKRGSMGTTNGEEEIFPFHAQVIIAKDFLYHKYTLNDTYPYERIVREFQMDKIIGVLAMTDSLRRLDCEAWAVLQNKKNSNGYPPLPEDYVVNKYDVPADKYGIERDQAIPLYSKRNLKVPERYNYDGALVKVNRLANDFSEVATCNFPGNYVAPTQYLKLLDDTLRFDKVIVIDRHNQNISTYEKVGDVWMIRSMNPATTGGNKTVYQRPTPLGLFVLQQKAFKMFYYKDGTEEIDGYSPYANRFCQGAYIHGVPVNLPETQIIEYSETLGTYPRSHMCVRNATSHAKFIYDYFPVYQSLIYVIE
jgi:hypothetical protein